MIKLNLLPAYVLERQVVKKVLLGVGVLLVAEIVGLGAVIGGKSKEVARLAAVLDKKKTERAEVEAIQAKAEAKNNQIAPFRNTVEFIERLAGSEAYSPPGVLWSDLIDQVVRYTYDRTQYSQITLANNGIGVQGQVDTPPAYLRYLMNLERCPLLGEIQPSVNLGAPGEGPVTFSVNATLSSPIETPGISAQAASQGGYGMEGEYGEEYSEEYESSSAE